MVENGRIQLLYDTYLHAKGNKRGINGTAAGLKVQNERSEANWW